jgi:hypothetical protein
MKGGKVDVRELKARDVKNLAKMLGKLKPQSVANLVSVLDNRNGNPMEIGLSIFHLIAADLTDDIYAWLADMIGVKTKDMDDMPASTPINIIKELASRGEFKDFLGSVTPPEDSPDSSLGSMTLSSEDMAGPTLS